ncbi:MAG: hypothetical protein PHI58_03875 [Candidatus Omnitrophica bacterium]|nr:hypothetical protein [Candidatus Omnitrophota bacterium]
MRSGYSNRKAIRAFTLVELLITASLMALVAVAILSVFAAGVKVYERVRAYSDARTDMLFSLEEMERDLRSVRNISQIKFAGESGKVTFPAVVHTNFAGKAGTSLGSISYYIDDSSHYLVKEERDYSAATAMEPPEGFITEMVYAENIKFSYYCYDRDSKSFSWKEVWAEEDDLAGGASPGKSSPPAGVAADKKNIVHTPLGIKIEIGCESNGESLVLTRMVFFPLAVFEYYLTVANEKMQR